MRANTLLPTPFPLPGDEVAFLSCFSGATRSLSNHRKTEESCTYIIRLHPKDDKTCFKKVFISINLILHIVFFSRADDDSC